MSAVALERPGRAPRVAQPRTGADALPRVLTSVLVGSFVCMSLAPSLLPRTALTQAIVTGLLAAIGLGASTLIHRIHTARPFQQRPIQQASGKATWKPTPSHRARRWRIAAVSAAVGAATIGIAGAAAWQNSLRAAMNVDTVGPAHWVEVVAVASAMFFVLYLLGATVDVVCARLGPIRSMAVAVLCIAGTYFFAGPALWDSLSTRFSTSNSAIDPTVAAPTSTYLAGSPDSKISWNTLGREGRKFIAAEGDSDAVRTYVGLDSAPTPAARTALALDDMVRAGAFSRSAIVVAVPTGSGWIDDHAVAGIETRFGGNVATVGMQYSDQPSWATFLFAESQARAAATALLDAVASHIDAMAAPSRPALYIYGQSLGSVGGSAAYSAAEPSVCGALWAGPPAGAVDTSAAVVLANSSDPVVRWSTALLFDPPDLDRTRGDAPAPQWIPVVSFLQTTIDMVSALDAPSGHGHRYGTDQGIALPSCDR